MIEDVTKRFDLAIQSKFKDKPDIKNFLLKHDRKKLCINRLCEQIVRAEGMSVLPNVAAYATVINDVAMMFAGACLKKAEEDHFSQSQRNAITRQQDALKDAEGLLKDLEKETINEKGLTEIERDEIRQAIASRSAD
jgi:hypothetical protein